jgi:hypothetical protein
VAPAKKTKADPVPKPAELTRRFGIAEWYGESFVALDRSARKELAEFVPDKRKRLSKAERDRLGELEVLAASGALGEVEAMRLSTLRRKKTEEMETNRRCPFRGSDKDAICTKDGGVCSLRLYERTGSAVVPITGDRSAIRALCPQRFHEANAVSTWVGEVLLGSSTPTIAREVGFLESEETVDGAGGEDVGRLDMILTRSDLPKDHPMQWCALEIQAVYFSGREMAKDFRAIAADPGDGLIWPTEIRRPDYRSSAPKRLMPQLQIKVPTLRRWGKKMAVVVDRAFFDSMGKMDTVEDSSNADIAWFIVDFRYVEAKKRFELARGDVVFTTLDEAVGGLTGGKPVSQSEFEKRILEKLS